MTTLNTNDLISVVMPVYNGQAYVREAIESILNQDYKRFELLLINDGSTDASEKIIESFNDARIVYIKNDTNLGLIESLDKGIRAAKGAYIARMDADDIAMPTRLCDQLNAFKNNPERIAVGSDYYVLEGNKLTHIKNIRDSDFIKTCLLFAPYFNHPTMMIKNRFKELDLSYDKNFVHAEDYRLWTQLSFHGAFYIVDKPLLKYRSHGSQISANHKQTQLQISATIRKSYLQQLGFKFSEEQFFIHNIIGNNEFIRSKETLLNINDWLQNLVQQNNDLQVMNSSSFNRAIHKFWIDSCGYTNLGLTAFQIYSQSSLSGYSDKLLSDKMKLAVKCAVRKFK